MGRTGVVMPVLVLRRTVWGRTKIRAAVVVGRDGWRRCCLCETIEGRMVKSTRTALVKACDGSLGGFRWLGPLLVSWGQASG
jgi:hypothetical protein